MSTATKLSTLQLELLKVYSFNPTEEELLEIKAMLGQFFAQKLARDIGEAAIKKGITNEDLDSWLNDEKQ